MSVDCEFSFVFVLMFSLFCFQKVYFYFWVSRLFIYLLGWWLYLPHNFGNIDCIQISVWCVIPYIYSATNLKVSKKKVKVKKEKVKVDPSVAVQRNVHNVVSLQFTWGKMTKLNEGLLSLLWLLWSIWHPDVCRSRSRGKFGNQDLYVNLFFCLWL